MEITAANIYGTSQNRSRSRSRTRNSTANSRSTSSTRRPSLGPSRRSLSSSSLNKLNVTATNIDQEKGIPTTTASVDNSLPLDFFKQDLIALIKGLKVSKWHKVPLSAANLSVSRISGALTNSIYKLEYQNTDEDFQGPPLPALLLRIYGKNVDSIIDRESELATLIKLSQKRIGPRLLGIFANGRFEQFLEGYITLNKTQIRDEVISQILGRRMKDLHYKIALEHLDISGDLPMAWRLIYKWLDMLEEQLTSTEVSGLTIDEESIFKMKYSEFRENIETYRNWLFDKYDTNNFSDNFKFCHNDTQYGNLLLHEDFDPEEIILSSTSNLDLKNAETNGEQVVMATTNKKDNSLAVIDFEYSGSNFPAFDLVNHFSEWMADYHDPVKSYYIHEDQYPSRLQQVNLIKSYIEYDFQYPSSNLKTSKTDDLSSSTNATDLIESEIKKLYNECIFWRPTVQIYWSLWGLIQSGPLTSTLASSTTSPGSLEEQGVDGTYSITTSLENLQVEETPIEEYITSSDDDFDYLKYSGQKIGLILGDLIQFGIISKDLIKKEYHQDLKILDCELFDI